MTAVLDGLRALGAARLVALAAVATGMLVMLGLLALRGGDGPQALLYADLDLREASQISDALERAHIAHQALDGGDRITVGATDVARARLLLAKDGLPSGGSIGYEIFDRGDSITSSQFQQQINETRAMEGELERSIRLLQGVRGARVHLVLPRREPFSRDMQTAKASVLLTMAGVARLDPEGVQAVLNLVSAAVPGLKPDAIAIIDSRGNLLARAGAPTGDDAIVQTAAEMRRVTGLRLSRAIEDMLGQSLGEGHVRAEAAVQMDFDKIKETTENYNPDQQVVRSTQSTSDKSTSTQADKGVSVQNNLPNADAGQAQSGSQDQKSDEVTNYEIGKTVRTLVHAQPQIARISLAVMIDGVTHKGPDGKQIWSPRTPQEIDAIKQLVQGAIGFDAKRGDTVDVVCMRFVDTDDAMASQPPGPFGLDIEKSDFLGLAQSAILAFVVLLALIFVLRPMALRLLALAPNGLMDMGDALLAGPDGMTRGMGIGMDIKALSGGGASGGIVGGMGGGMAGAAGMIADESMVNMANIEGQLRASSIRKLSEMVEKHPEASLSIMRGWMTQEQH